MPKSYWIGLVVAALGKLEDGKIQLAGPRKTEQGDVLWKVVWTGIDGKNPQRETFRSTDEGQSWQADSKLVLKRAF